MSFFYSQKLFISILIVSTFLTPSSATAQKKFSKTYPTSKNIRLQLTNRSGTVTVTAWQRKEIKIIARMEAPAAKVLPEMSGDGLIINVVRDNYGKNEIGNVNFEVFVPAQSMVDIETRVGNLTVKDVHGAMVRARITSEGDITLSGIESEAVMAENVIGDIFFDGSLQSGGNYRFASTKGNINLQLPFSSSFRLVATAPSTRSISLGAFSNSGLNFVSDGRRVVGSVGGGDSSLSVSNQRGSISFIRK